MGAIDNQNTAVNGRDVTSLKLEHEQTDNRTNSDQSRNRAGARKGFSKVFPRAGGVDGRGRATNSDDFGLVQCGVTLGGVLGALGLRLGVVVCADAASRQRRRGRPLWGAVYPPTCKASSFHHGDRRRDWAAVFTAGRDPSKPQRIQRTDVDHWWHGWQMGDRGWTAACSCRPTTAARAPLSTPSRVLGPLAVVSAGESPVQFGRTGPGFQPPAPNGRVAFTAPNMRGTPGAKRSSSTGTPALSPSRRPSRTRKPLAVTGD